VGSGHHPRFTWAIQERGGRGWLAALGGGAMLGLVGLVLPAFLSDPAALASFAVLLGVVAGVYLGFALVDGRISVFGIEGVMVLVFVSLGVRALIANNAWLLVGGYLGHAAWDSLHPHAVDTHMPWWYVPACIGFDVVFGVYILSRLV
jgi:hypothetical protein